MCTLMQKDVLIEMVATAQADLSKVLALPLNEDQLSLSRLRSEIYRSSPEQIDFAHTAMQINQIRMKYLNFSQSEQYV